MGPRYWDRRIWLALFCYRAISARLGKEGLATLLTKRNPAGLSGGRLPAPWLGPSTRDRLAQLYRLSRRFTQHPRLRPG